MALTLGYTGGYGYLVAVARAGKFNFNPGKVNTFKLARRINQLQRYSLDWKDFLYQYSHSCRDGEAIEFLVMRFMVHQAISSVYQLVNSDLFYDQYAVLCGLKLQAQEAIEPIILSPNEWLMPNQTLDSNTLNPFAIID